MRFVRYFLLVLLLCESFYAVAQKKGGAVVVTVLFRSDVQLSGQDLYSVVTKSGGLTEYLYALPGAAAVLKQKGDTIAHTLSGGDGVCVFKNIPHGDYSLEISHYGYDTYITKFEHSSKQSTIDAILSEGSVLLEAIKVKGDIPLVLRKGDTLVVNPLAVETPIGAAAIEIIKQVPGIEITEGGGLTVNGEPLVRSYVGGSQLFGSGVLTALQNLDADLVKNIEFYDEVEYTGLVNGRGEKRKVKVMNIQTTKELLASLTGHLLAGIGTDVRGGDADKLRYKAGASINLFNSKVAITSSAAVNNVNLANTGADYLNTLLSERSNGENRLASARVNVEKIITDSSVQCGRVTLEYRFNNTDNFNGSHSTREYFPNENYQNRYYFNEKQNYSKDNRHSISFNLNNATKSRKAFYDFTHNMSLEQGRSSIYSNMGDQTDKFSSFISDTSVNSIKNWKISDNFMFFTINGFDLNANFSFGKDNGNSFRKVDENGTERVFESTPVGNHLLSAVQARFQLYSMRNEKNHLYVNASVSSRYENQRRKQLRYDMTGSTPVFDENNSFFYTNDNWNNSVEFQMSWGTDKTKSTGETNLTGSKVIRSGSLSLGVNHTLINDHNKLRSSTAKKSYYMPQASVNLNFKDLGITYSLSSTVPYVEQLRDYVDDKNPLYLRGGNPDLKVTLSHTLNLSYRNGSSYYDLTSWNIHLRGAIRQNPIVPYSVYYTEQSVLPQYGGYVVQPGVTLESYKNVKNEKDLNLSFEYNTRFSAIKTKFNMFLSGSYYNKYSYIGDQLNETDTYSTQLMMVANTSFRWMNLTLYSTTGYSASSNSLRNNYNYLNQSLKTTLNFTILKVWYLTAAYNFVFNKPTGNTAGILNRNNILNAATGVNLFKGRLKAGISVFDIFDSSTDFSTMLYSDYIQNTWTPSFGRYISFDIVFNLRKSRFKE